MGGHRPAVVSIFETEDYSAIMELGLTWGDVFEIACEPACTPEQGLQWGLAILERRGARGEHKEGCRGRRWMDVQRRSRR